MGSEVHGKQKSNLQRSSSHEDSIGTTEIIMLQNHLSSKQDELERARKEGNLLEKNKKILQDQIGSVSEFPTTQILDNINKYHQLQKDLHSTQKEVSELLEKNLSLQNGNSALQEDLEQLQATLGPSVDEINEIADFLKQMNDTKLSEIELKQSLVNRRNEIEEQVKKQRDFFAKELSISQKELDDVTSLCNLVETKKKEYKEMIELKGSSDNEVSLLEIESKQHQEKMKKLRKKIQLAKTEHSKLEKEILKLKETCKNTEETRYIEKKVFLESEISEIKKKHNEEIRSANLKLQELKSKSKSLKKKRETLQERIQSPSSMPINDDIKKELFEKQEKLKNLQEHIPEKLEQLRQLIQHEYDTIEEEEKIGEKLLVDLREVEDYLSKKETQTAQKDLTDVTNQIKEMQERVDKREREHKEIMEKRARVVNERKRAETLIRKHRSRTRKQQRKQRAKNVKMEIFAENNATLLKQEDFVDTVPPTPPTELPTEEEPILLPDGTLRSSTGERWVTVSTSVSGSKKSLQTETTALNISVSRFNALTVQQHSDEEEDSPILSKSIKKDRRINRKTKKPTVVPNNNSIPKSSSFLWAMFPLTIACLICVFAVLLFLLYH